MVHCLHDFYDQELDPIFFHTVTTLQFKCIPSPQRVPLVNHRTNKMPKWKAEISLQFINTLNKTKINDLYKHLQHMEMNLSSFTKVCYRDVQQNIWYFTEAHGLTQSNKHHSPVKHPNSSAQKPEVGMQCRMRCRRARAKYHFAKKIHSRNPSQTNKTTLTNASKLYLM